MLAGTSVPVWAPFAAHQASRRRAQGGPSDSIWGPYAVGLIFFILSMAGEGYVFFFSAYRTIAVFSTTCSNLTSYSEVRLFSSLHDVLRRESSITMFFFCVSCFGWWKRQSICTSLHDALTCRGCSCLGLPVFCCNGGTCQTCEMWAIFFSRSVSQSTNFQTRLLPFLLVQSLTRSSWAWSGCCSAPSWLCSA